MTDNLTGYVKKETMLLIAVAAAVTGFLLGAIVFKVYTPSDGTRMPGAPPSQQQAKQGQQPGFSPEQANQILALEQEVAANPNNGDAWTKLGHIWFDTNRPAKAIEAYNRSLAIKPNDANVLTDLGVMYRKTGQFDQAIASFDKAIAADPRHEISRFNKGVVLMYDVKDTAGAITAWEGLVQVNPSAKTPNGELIADVIKKIKSEAGQK